MHKETNSTVNQRFNRHQLILHLFIIICVSYLAFFYRLGARPVADPDEGRYAESVREMVLHKEWITPTFNNELRLQKPILFYWLTIVAQNTFGLNEFALRFFPAFFGFLTVLLIYGISRLLFSPLEGLLAALILCTSVLFISVARLVLPDMCLSFFITLALASLFFFTTTEKRVFLVPAYAAIGLGLLTKGPVALILPALVIIVFWLTQGKLRLLKKSKPLLGLIIILAIGLPWFIPLVMKHKDIIRYYFIEETLQRFFTSKHERTQGPHFFPLLFISTFFPWSLFLIGAAITLFKRGLKRYLTERPVEIFLWLWLIIPLIFFCISKSQQPVYIVPLFPPAAILCARWISENLFSRYPKTSTDWSWLIPASVCLFALILLLAAPIMERNMEYYSLTLYISAVVFLLFNGAALLLWLRSARRIAFWLIPFSILLNFIILLPDVDYFLGQRRSTKEPSEFLLPILRPSDNVAYYESDARASMMFYLKRTIASFEDARKLKRVIEKYPGRTFVFCKKRNLDELIEEDIVDRILYRGHEFICVLAKAPSDR